MAREELGEKRGAQPPTLELGGSRCCIDIATATGQPFLVLMTVTFRKPTSGAIDLDSLEILTALGACVRARRWAGREIWAGKWARRRLRARGGAAATSR